MKKLEAIESNISSISNINDADKKIDNNFNRVNGCIRNATKRFKILHRPKDHPEGIGKEELRMVKEAQFSKDFKGGALVGKTAFAPPIVGTNSIAGGPVPSSTIHEFDENGDAFDLEKT